jgi:hypothetical protein
VAQGAAPDFNPHHNKKKKKKKKKNRLSIRTGNCTLRSAQLSPGDENSWALGVSVLQAHLLSFFNSGSLVALRTPDHLLSSQELNKPKYSQNQHLFP